MKLISKWNHYLWLARPYFLNFLINSCIRNGNFMFYNWYSLALVYDVIGQLRYCFPAGIWLCEVTKWPKTRHVNYTFRQISHGDQAAIFDWFLSVQLSVFVRHDARCKQFNEISQLHKANSEHLKLNFFFWLRSNESDSNEMIEVNTKMIVFGFLRSQQIVIKSNRIPRNHFFGNLNFTISLWHAYTWYSEDWTI